MVRVKWMIVLFFAIVTLEGRAERQTVKSVFEKWPVGVYVAIDIEINKLREVKKAGFEYVEVKFSNSREITPAERRTQIASFKKNVEACGLKVWSVHLPYWTEWDISTLCEENRTQWVKDICGLMRDAMALSPRKFVLHASAEPIKDEERKARLSASIRSIREVALVARELGVQLLIEDLPRTCLGNTSTEMKYILQQVDTAVGVCFDSNHLLQESSVHFAKELGKEIGSLHISDYDGVDEKHWLPGRGIVDWKGVVETLVEEGYDGVFMFEVSVFQHYEEIMNSWKWIREQLKN